MTDEDKELEAILTAGKPVWVGVGTLFGELKEISKPEYRRQQLDYDLVSSELGQIINQTATNRTAMTFGPAVADWGSITAVAFFRSETDKRHIKIGILSTPILVATTHSLQFAPGQIYISLASKMKEEGHGNSDTSSRCAP